MFCFSFKFVENAANLGVSCKSLCYRTLRGFVFSLCLKCNGVWVKRFECSAQTLFAFGRNDGSVNAELWRENIVFAARELACEVLVGVFCLSGMCIFGEKCV